MAYVEPERQRTYNPQFLARVMARRRAEELAAQRASQRKLAAERAERERVLIAEAKAAHALVLATNAIKVETGIAEAIARLPPGQFERIVRRACRVFKVSPVALKGEIKDKKHAAARQFIGYWAARLTSLSLQQIGRRMNRDHTTVIHSVQIYPTKRAKAGRTLRKAR